MSSRLAAASPHAAGEAYGRFHIEPWNEHHHESAATAIALAYSDHMDSQINDQYRTLAGARRFIYNIVQFPGCGTFFKPGSYVAFDLATGWLDGRPRAGELCGRRDRAHHSALRDSRGAGRGLGYELLRQAVATLRLHGAKRISLTVTWRTRKPSGFTSGADSRKCGGFRRLSGGAIEPDQCFLPPTRLPIIILTSR